MTGTICKSQENRPAAVVSWCFLDFFFLLFFLFARVSDSHASNPPLTPYHPSTAKTGACYYTITSVREQA